MYGSYWKRFGTPEEVNVFTTNTELNVAKMVSAGN
jgi:hypothetical protein